MYGPLVVLLENFDRADALSWSLLSRCAEEIDMPVMVIVAVRPNDGVFASPLPGQVCKIPQTYLKECVCMHDKISRAHQRPSTHVFPSMPLSMIPTTSKHMQPWVQYFSLRHECEAGARGITCENTFISVSPVASETFSLVAAKAALHAKMSALLEDIRENPFTLRMMLQPFTPKHTQAFLNAALDGVLVSSDVAHNLWEKTGGLPLYIEQVCTLLSPT